MTTPPRQPALTPLQIRDLVTAVLHDSGLHVEVRRNELIVTNPRDPEKGQVVITLNEGYVSWERTETAYWGTLEGVDTSPDAQPVAITKIIETLTDQP
jgi:hypothetical protein